MDAFKLIKLGKRSDIKLKDCPVEGYVLCEQVRYIDLAARHFSKLTATHYFDIMDISDAVMGIFDYQAL